MKFIVKLYLRQKKIETIFLFADLARSSKEVTAEFNEFLLVIGPQ